MSLPTQTPWEMLQEFFIEFDGKINDYAEVDLGKIKLCKNADGSITVYDPGLEDSIEHGRYSDKAKILVEGKIEHDHGVLGLELKSAPNMILSKRKYHGHSYYSIKLSHYPDDGHEIRLLVCEPGLQSMCHYIDNIKYGGESDVIIQNVNQTKPENIIQINVDEPWDLIVGYLRSSIKGKEINKDKVNKIVFYLKNESSNSIEYLEMKRDDKDTIIIDVSKPLTQGFRESDFRGNKVIKENLLIGEDGERKEIRICEEGESITCMIYIDEYPRGDRGNTMRLGFAMKPNGIERIIRINSYKIIGIEVN